MSVVVEVRTIKRQWRHRQATRRRASRCHAVAPPPSASAPHLAMRNLDPRAEGVSAAPAGGAAFVRWWPGLRCQDGRHVDAGRSGFGRQLSARGAIRSRASSTRTGAGPLPKVAARLHHRGASCDVYVRGASGRGCAASSLLARRGVGCGADSRAVVANAFAEFLDADRLACTLAARTGQRSAARAGSRVGLLPGWSCGCLRARTSDRLALVPHRVELRAPLPLWSCAWPRSN